MQRYPAIDLARQAIAKECPQNVDLTLKPWCERKVMVVLGDGDPGMSADDYYPNVARLHGELPEKLLDDVKAAGIAIHTLCVGDHCAEVITRYRPLFLLSTGRYRTSSFIPSLRLAPACPGPI